MGKWIRRILISNLSNSSLAESLAESGWKVNAKGYACAETKVFAGATMAELHQGWIDEKQFWDAGKQICAAGKVCGHYTQMVWKTSTDIGCGIIRNGNSIGAEYKGQVSYIVCTYNPGGNTDGEKAH